MYVLLVNAGSSSLKCGLMEVATGGRVAAADAEWSGAQTHYRFERPGGERRSEPQDWRDHVEALRGMFDDLVHPDRRSEVVAVGHRIVHGGGYRTARVVDASVRKRIKELSALAPQHNPASLATLDAAESMLPNVPHVATFDTCFHQTLPKEMATYAVPHAWTRDWGVRRYGFHGLSHDYCARRVADLMDRPLSTLRLITCHLGHGCSAAAIAGARCLDTTMGFTPLEGLMMASRCGDVDPGVLLWVQRAHALTPAEVDHCLRHESGLLGVSGISADMRAVIEAVEAGEPRATLAVEMYVHRLRKAIGGLFVALGGLDALIFTAGVGENSPLIRRRVCEGLDCLGLQLDMERNEALGPDHDIATSGSPRRIFVLKSREEITMFRQVHEVLQLQPER